MQNRIEEIEIAKETGKHINIPSVEFLLEMIRKTNKKSESAKLNQLSNKVIDTTKSLEEEHLIPDKDETTSSSEPLKIEKAPPTQIKDRIAPRAPTIF
jgi:hypothetical protein